MNDYHRGVLVKTAIDYLNVKKGGLYIDATAGGGGHTREILQRGGKVLAIDRDPDSIDFLKKQNRKNLILDNSNFSHIYKTAQRFGFNKVSGIIFDLGVSSHQLEDAKRGFSFTRNGPLDMRMNPSINITAYDLINNLEKRRLNEIFKTYGQEKFSWSISSAICSARQIKPISSTLELARIVSEVYAKKSRNFRIDHGVKKIHPATKVFQALRIVINSELLNLEEALPQTVDLLIKGGRLVVISFHSLEDAKVKRFFKQEKRLKVLTKTPIDPRKREVLENPRSRSARLRAAEKI